MTLSDGTAARRSEVDTLSCVGAGALPIKWTWQGTDAGESGTTTAYETNNVEAFAATRRSVAEFESRGFALHDASRVVLYKNESPGAKPIFGATLYLSLQRGVLVLRIGIDLGRADTVATLIESAGSAIEGGYVTSSEDRIPGGAGQRMAVLAKAHELHDLAKDIADVATHVEVRYATRGGKFGRMDKTALSSFSFADLNR